MMGIVVPNMFRVVASSWRKIQTRSTCMHNFDVLPSVICSSGSTTTSITATKQQKQQRRHVWNASYENDKEANAIVQSIQQFKTRIIDPTTGNHNADAQRQILKLKQDYRQVTGEEYDDDNEYAEHHQNEITTTLDHPSNHDKPSNSMSNHHANETAR